VSLPAAMYTTAAPSDQPPCRHILGMRVDATTYDDATRRILSWAALGAGGHVYAANVHMVMESRRRPDLAAAVATARLVTPDGMPLVHMLRRLGVAGQPRVYGPDLTLAVLAAAAAQGVPLGLYGGRPETLEILQRVYPTRFPGLRIVFAVSPPFRPATQAENAATVDAIASSGARILLVGLGCPKQELWAATHSPHLPCVILAVGAAFDFHAGTVRQAPPWMQQLALEWLYRLGREPRRLFWRYAWHNPRFAVLAVWQLLRHRRTDGS
jgi:N-acetylglucosaminyldiphosphoundecaprenol N-acetyl-beta-D-mannosaminyltransferase